MSIVVRRRTDLSPEEQAEIRRKAQEVEQYIAEVRQRRKAQIEEVALRHAATKAR